MRVNAASAVIVWCLLAAVARAGAQDLPGTSRYIDPAAGLTVAQAIAEGLRQEPGLRETRSAIDAARGDRRQAGLRPNPSVSAERREQLGGSDNQTMLGFELSLDLFRRGARIAVADRIVTVME